MILRSTTSRLIHFSFKYYSQMATSLNKILSPPTSVRGMMELEKDKFRFFLIFFLRIVIDLTINQKFSPTIIEPDSFHGNFPGRF